jgi:hypothetical protein
VLVAVIGTIVIVAVLVAAGLWVDRRVSLMPRAEDLDEASRPKPLGGEHEAGMAPQSALRSDPTRMQRVIARQRCTCAAHTELAAAGDEEVRYGDKLLRVFRLTCPTCGTGRSLYFDPRP